jgi:hypothetical protein
MLKEKERKEQDRKDQEEQDQEEQDQDLVVEMERLLPLEQKGEILLQFAPLSHLE